MRIFKTPLFLILALVHSYVLYQYTVFINNSSFAAILFNFHTSSPLKNQNLFLAKLLIHVRTNAISSYGVGGAI